MTIQRQGDATVLTDDDFLTRTVANFNYCGERSAGMRFRDVIEDISSDRWLCWRHRDLCQH